MQQPTPDPASLDNLHDIIVPDPVSVWPLAPGWYGLGWVLLIALAFWVWSRMRQRRLNRYRREALAANLWWWIGGLVIAICIAAWLFRHFYHPFAIRLSAWRSRRADREAAYFARLKTACRSGDAAMAYDALTHWIDRLYDGEGAPTIEQFVHDAKDAELRDQKEQLERQLFAAPATPHAAWSGEVFYQRLAAVRQRMNQRTTRYNQPGQPALPPLNPSALRVSATNSGTSRVS